MVEQGEATNAIEWSATSAAVTRIVDASVSVSITALW
jgi:hypothetical protein